MSFLKHFDYLGTEPIFFINEKRTIKSKFGGILSMLLTFLLAASTGYFSYLLFSRTNYTVILNEGYNNYPFKDWTNGEIAIQVVDPYMNELPEKDRLLGITANWWINRPTEVNGTVQYMLESEDVPLQTCDLQTNFKNDIDLWKDQKLINSSTCLQPGYSWNSTYAFGDLNYTGVVFWIHKCINTTVKTDCLPQEEIDQILTNVFFVVRFKDYYFDHKILNYTGIPYIYSDTVQASVTAYKRVWYSFRNVQYSTDEGYIFPENLDYNFTTFATYRESTDLRTNATIPESFAVVSLNMYTLKQSYNRTFYKIQNMIADLGGITKGMLMIATIINYYFNERLYFNEIVNFNIKNFPSNISEDDLYVSNHKSNLASNHLFDPSKIKSVSENEKFKNQLNTDNIRKINIDSGVIDTVHRNKLKLNTLNFKDKLKKFKARESILPIWCFGKKYSQKSNVKTFNMVKELVQKQLDMFNIIKKLNMLDKLQFIFAGQKYNKLLETCGNPLYLIRSEDEVKEIPLEWNAENMVNFFERNLNFILKS